VLPPLVGKAHRMRNGGVPTRNLRALNALKELKAKILECEAPVGVTRQERIMGAMVEFQELQWYVSGHWR
jgi:hypothetical protein